MNEEFWILIFDLEATNGKGGSMSSHKRSNAELK